MAADDADPRIAQTSTRSTKAAQACAMRCSSPSRPQPSGGGALRFLTCAGAKHSVGLGPGNPLPEPGVIPLRAAPMLALYLRAPPKWGSALRRATAAPSAAAAASASSAPPSSASSAADAPPLGSLQLKAREAARPHRAQIELALTRGRVQPREDK